MEHVCKDVPLYIHLGTWEKTYAHIYLLTHMPIFGTGACVLSRWVCIYPCNHYLEAVTLSKLMSLLESWLCHPYNTKPCLPHGGFMKISEIMDVKHLVLWLAHSKCSINISFPYPYKCILIYICVYLHTYKSTKIHIKILTLGRVGDRH